MTELTPDQIQLIESSMSFLRNVKHTVGEDACNDALNALKPILGPLWSRTVISLILKDGLGASSLLIGYGTIGETQAPGMSNYIEFIKQIRSWSGFGLVAAKTLAERARSGEVIQITVKKGAYGLRLFGNDGKPNLTDLQRAAGVFEELGATVKLI